MVKRFPPPANGINTPTKDGKTFLHYATRGGSEEIVKDFLARGARLDAAHQGPESPLYYAIQYCPETTVALLIDKGAKPLFKDESGRTALHLACARGSAPLVRRFLALSMDVTARDISGETPLHLAARNGNVETVRLLLDAKAPVNIVQATGATPLHYAAFRGHLDAARLLLERGAFTEIKDMESQTPARAAEAGRHPELAKLLADWSQAHPEARQTKLPDAGDTTQSRLATIRNYQGDSYVLILVPIGAADRQVIEELQARLRQVLGISVLLEDLTAELPPPEEATRKAPTNDGHRQWNAGRLIAALQGYAGFHGRPNIGVLGVTGEDIYMEGLNYAFGMAGKGAAVMSYYYLRARDHRLTLKRMTNQALSSTGLLFSIPRCKDKSCPRSYPNSIQEHDAKSDFLCPQCREGFTKRFGVAGKTLQELPGNSEPDNEIF